MSKQPADNDLRAVLRDGASRLGLAVDEAAQQSMLDYLALLGEWNRAYNLTAVKDPMQQVTHHLLDSLSVLPWLHGKRVADIGTGAGLPGIPLAIVQPEKQFTLLDSRGKKTRFLGHVARQLGLENVEIVTARIEDYRPPAPFDTVVARALAVLPRLANLAEPLLAPDAILLAMKGRDPVEEVRALPTGWRVRDKRRLEVPGLQAERHVVVIEKN